MHGANLVLILELSEHVFTEIAAHGVSAAWGVTFPGERLRVKSFPIALGLKVVRKQFYWI